MGRDIEYELRRHFCVDYKQGDALARLNGRPNTRIFSFEAPRFKAGCRKFITADLRAFYLFYRSCQLARHFYEIIPENVPCRLYFDLEYYKTYNPTVDPLKMLGDFLDVCVDVILEKFGFTLDRRRGAFVILDSSTADKFSAHVIVHLPGGRLFPSNVAIKPLVKFICQRMLERNVCLVEGENGADDVKFFCDLAVYTKNRNFRLFLSSKCGKESVLRLADYCTFYEESPKNAQVFLDSLIVPKDYNLYEILEMPEIILTHPKQSSLKPVVLKNVENIIRPSDTETTSDVRELKSGRVPSPFPELDDHMLSVFQALKPDARIRIWRILLLTASNARIMQYQLTNCRYCYNKQREHKSQNVYWSVSLDEFTCVQRCFDVIDCFRFSSQKFPIPPNIVEQISPRIEKIYERLLHDLAYSESFYSSHYDRLFLELLHPTQLTPTAEDDDEEVIVL